MRTYILCWEFGTHHVNVYVSKKDFYRVIDNMSEEFVIYKTFQPEAKPNAVFYYIENYYGDMQMIGFTFTVNEV